ncbi:MAG: 3,4-dihydroxy-2-butanone-4-phosphate synthase [Alphaproteobacteria bacterium]
MTENNLSPIEDVIKDIAAGKMVILVDDEDRENEGDLVIAGEFADAEAVNFMAKHGRGLICLTLTQERADRLDLKPMTTDNTARHKTAFTVSIEAREGVTTGISAADRARTISVAIDIEKGAVDIASPGHVFPLTARDGGVLVRAGHTEAAVDLSKLAGLNPSGVICEIMNEDGTMARMKDLIPFAKKMDLKIATICDLIAYRKRFDHLVEKISETSFETKIAGTFQHITYRNTISGEEHLALVKGDLSEGGKMLVRVHPLNLLKDALYGLQSETGWTLQAAMEEIDAEGKGVIVLIQDGYSKKISQKAPDKAADLRDYGVGAQILLDLGVREMVLLSNTAQHFIGLEGYGLEIIERRKK